MAVKPAWSLGARQGPLRRHKEIVFFACEGLIAMLDERTHDEEYVVVTPDDFQKRAQGLADLGKPMAKDSQKWMRTDGRAMLAAANDMVTTVKEAEHMGDPSSPAVRAWWQKHRRNSTVSFSEGSDPAGYPTLPEMPVGKFTGRTADAGAPADTAGGIIIGGGDSTKIRRKPKKKARGLILTPDIL